MGGLESFAETLRRCGGIFRFAATRYDVKSGYVPVLDVEGVTELSTSLSTAGYPGPAAVLRRQLEALKQSRPTFAPPADVSPDYRERARRKRFRETLGSVAKLLETLAADEKVVSIGRPGEEPPAVPDEPTYLGGGQLRIGAETIAVTGQKRFVLEALIRLRSATKDKLAAESGVPDAPRILRRLRAMHPALERAITMPGRRDAGGYRTTIENGK